MLAAAVTAACAPAGPEPGGPPAQRAFLGVETLMLDDDLVSVRVAVAGAESREIVDAYARCAAAQYALIRGAGFARHVRTRAAQSAGIWRADAVYTISAALPRGSATVDAEVTVQDCGARGIPTV